MSLHQVLPWEKKTGEWIVGRWYPMPIGALWLDDSDVYHIEGYNIFTADPSSRGDILPVLPFGDTFNLRTAIDICSAHNGTPIWEGYETEEKSE